MSARRRTIRVRSVPVVLAVGAGIAASFLVVGCGSSTGARVAQVPSNPTTTAAPPTGQGELSQAGGSAFSACMRAHGVASFPDPDSSGKFQAQFGPGTGMDPSSPRFKSAQDACRKLLPGGGAPSPQQQARLVQALVKYSACMRSHGLPKFPDPTVGPNQGMVLVGPGSGIDPNSPKLQAADRACRKFQPAAPGVAPSSR